MALFDGPSYTKVNISSGKSDTFSASDKNISRRKLTPTKFFPRYGRQNEGEIFSNKG